MRALPDIPRPNRYPFDFSIFRDKTKVYFFKDLYLYQKASF